MTTLVATFVGAACCRTAFAQIPPPQILRWEIQATVIQIDEPVGVLNEVRLGDPVRGSLTFHRSVVPDGGFYNSYTHPATFAVTRMIVDNPRTGGEIVFEPAKDYSAYHNIDVYNDTEDDDEAIIDYIIALDDVIPPLGLEADFPVTAVELTGPPDVLQDLSFPLELDLADWPLAILSYIDLLGGAAVYAEIYSLTPVEVTFAASDFDFDGDVDSDDLQVWTANFGTDGYPDADADFDYDADGDDFLAWQRQFDGSASSSTAAIPEPATLLLCIAAAAGVRRLGRRQRQELANA